MTLPDGWELRPLGDVAITALGKMLDRSRPRGDTEVPYLRNVNVQWDRVDTTDVLTMKLADDERERFEVLMGDVLICEGGEIGRTAIWNGRVDYIAYQKALHRVRPLDALTPRFLLHLMHHLAASGQLERYATGTTIAHLPQQQLRRLPLPLPPVNEQRRIVDILEDHLSRLDAAADLLATAQRRLFAHGRAALDSLTEAAAAEHVCLGDLVSHIESGKSLGGAAPPSTDDEWGIVRVSAMTWGEFRPEENKRAPDQSNINLDHQIHAGDLLVSRANTSEYVGAPVLVRDEPRRLLLSDKSLRLVPREDVAAEYLWRILAAPRARQQISDRASGNQDSMRNISQRTLKSVKVPWTGRQQEVIKAAHELDEHQRQLSVAIGVALSRASALRRALLQAAFSGRLTGQSSDLERAEQMAQ